MPNQDFETLMLPLLESLRSGEDYSIDYVRAQLTQYVEWSDNALKKFDPDKNKHEFESSTWLALEHLVKAGLVEQPVEGRIKLTALGKLVLSKRLNALDVSYLRRLPRYLENQ